MGKSYVVNDVKATFGSLVFLSQNGTKSETIGMGRDSTKKTLGVECELLSDTQDDVTVYIPTGKANNVAAYGFEQPVKLVKPRLEPVGRVSGSVTYIEQRVFADDIVPV